MILQEQYYEDLVDCIHSTPETVFWRGFVNKNTLLKNKELLDKMWTTYQTKIESGIDANYAYAYTLEEDLDIPLFKWEDIFHKCIEGRYSEFYG